MQGRAPAASRATQAAVPVQREEAAEEGRRRRRRRCRADSEVLRPVERAPGAPGDADADRGEASVLDVRPMAGRGEPSVHHGLRRAVARGDVLPPGAAPVVAVPSALEGATGDGWRGIVVREVPVARHVHRLPDRGCLERPGYPQGPLADGGAVGVDELDDLAREVGSIGSPARVGRAVRGGARPRRLTERDDDEQQHRDCCDSRAGTASGLGEGAHRAGNGSAAAEPVPALSGGEAGSGLPRSSERALDAAMRPSPRAPGTTNCRIRGSARRRTAGRSARSRTPPSDRSSSPGRGTRRSRRRS